MPLFGSSSLRTMTLEEVQRASSDKVTKLIIIDNVVYDVTNYLNRCAFPQHMISMINQYVLDLFGYDLKTGVKNKNHFHPSFHLFHVYFRCIHIKTNKHSHHSVVLSCRSRVVFEAFNIADLLIVVIIHSLNIDKNCLMPRLQRADRYNNPEARRGLFALANGIKGK
jgi:hypothetical protein